MEPAGSSRPAQAGFPTPSAPAGLATPSAQAGLATPSAQAGLATLSAQAGLATQVSVTIAEPAWRRLVPRADRLAVRAARAAGGGASVVLATDRAVQRLNARHRGRNKPTNVLTYDPPAPGLPGEIILALGTIRREAALAGRRPAHHLAHLVVHGALHLAGHDHHHAGEARRMEMAETRILHRLHVPNPWRRT